MAWPRADTPKSLRGTERVRKYGGLALIFLLTCVGSCARHAFHQRLVWIERSQRRGRAIGRHCMSHLPFALVILYYVCEDELVSMS